MNELSRVSPEELLRLADRYARSCGEGFTVGTCVLNPGELRLHNPVRVRVRFVYPGVLHVSLHATGQHLVSSLPGRPLRPVRPKRSASR